MNHLIHDTPGFRLEVQASSDPRTGTTLQFISTWPKANHPDPHRLLALSLPPESLRALAELLNRLAEPHCGRPGAESAGQLDRA